jgi:hypothetical protein
MWPPIERRRKLETSLPFTCAGITIFVVSVCPATFGGIRNSCRSVPA